MYKNIYYISKIVTFLYKKFFIYVTIAELPPLDRYRKGVVLFMDLVLSFMLSILASVIAYYICKWLDRK